MAGLSKCTGTEHTAPKLSTSMPLSPALAELVVSKSMLPHTSVRFRWLAQAHTAAMQEVLTQAPAIRKMDAEHRCAAIATIARNQFATIEAGSGVHDRALYETALSHALARIHCATAQPLSMWAAGASVTAAHTEEPTYADYSDALHTAMLSGATPDETAANLDAVVASATDLSPAQADTLSALASLGASSAYYWYNVQTSYGYSGDYNGDLTPPQYQTFMFQALCGTWCKIGWQDLAGGILGAEGLLLGSIMGAVVNSAAAYIMM